MGVLNDNKRDFAAAAKCYDLFLRICVKIEDHIGESLACNALGVTYVEERSDERRETTMSNDERRETTMRSDEKRWK